MPSCCKIAKVVPIHKSGSKDDMNNYRPISLLPATSKVLEKVMHNRLYGFLTKHKILRKCQYGFRKKHSTKHAISELVYKITDGYDKNEHTLSVFLDLTKAFDLIDHEILLQKLHHYGIRGMALNWFHSYLKERKQFVKYNEVQSDQYEMMYGVPQGSVLGPLLFILYTNDTVDCLDKAKGIFFADDSTIYYTHSVLQTLYKCINDDLETLTDWYKANKLVLNITKTNYILFTPQTKNKDINTLQIKLGTDIVERKNETKFLGIFLDQHLK